MVYLLWNNKLYSGTCVVDKHSNGTFVVEQQAL